VILKDALASAIGRLTAAHVGSPRLNAELLLMFTLGCDRAYLFAHPERELTAEEQIRYDETLTQRGGGIPAQYITGHQEFWGMDFIVTPAVLIPRPETEHVIETVLELCKAGLGPRTSDLKTGTENQTPDVRRPKSEVRIIDIGTGSGCIAIALAKELPGSTIFATDISSPALAVSRRNAARHKVANQIQFLEGNLLDMVATQFDLIASNPPYVGRREAETLMREVRDHEPEIALYGGEEGYEFYAELITQAAMHLKPDGILILELGHNSLSAVQPILDAPTWTNVGVTNDLAGIPRVIAAERL